eukprot:m.372943 g.372943  ORF g.372943 m.372943 type:complete len:289 (-) comp20881_c0_seq4:1496-2362(-)
MARRDLHECWQRQVDEMDAMEALHAEWFECDDEVTAAKIRSTLETTIVEDIPEAQENGLNLRYTIWLESCESTRTVGCRVTLPMSYPESGLPQISIVTRSNAPVTKSEGLKIQSDVLVEIQELLGDECIFQAVDVATASLNDLLAGKSDSVEEHAREERDAQNITVGRRLIWFHHIKSPTKKRHIETWGSELNLRGYYKPGYPGILIVEGAEDSVEEYCSRLRALTWKAMVVKGTDVENDSHAATASFESRLRFKHNKVLPLEEGDMKVLAEHCRKAGLHDLFMTQMH